MQASPLASTVTAMEEERDPVRTAECISCGKVMLMDWIASRAPENDDQIDMTAPVYDGIYLKFSSHGNYGSRMLDMDHYSVHGFLCDECHVQKSDRMFAKPSGSESHIGTRLSEFKPDLRTYDTHGPAYFARYQYVEHRWVDGVQLYREMKSEQRSQIETILMQAGKDAQDVTLPRSLLDGLLGALRASEHNVHKMLHESQARSRENEEFKRQLAGEPREKEILALLHKEASELTVAELKDLLETLRWYERHEFGFRDLELFYADGTRFNPNDMRSEATTKASDALRAYEESHVRNDPRAGSAHQCSCVEHVRQSDVTAPET